jgi:uncharacterized protein YqgC (DUF456 family)
MKLPTGRELKSSRILRTIAGVLLLTVGLAGLLLPILPGWLLIFVGLALLGVKVPYADRLMSYAREKMARKKGGAPQA